MLKESIPEIDLLFTIDEYDTMWEKIAQYINVQKKCDDLSYYDRIITTGPTTAYLKIAEGCSNNCTYCAIPYIRGKCKSRKIEDIVVEAKLLASEGIEELIIIAQDTTKYGIDIYKKPRLEDLLKKLCKIEEIKWIRLLYANPASINDELIKLIKKQDKICKYFDIPIQHISNLVLKRMNRKGNEKNIKTLIKKIRKEIPEAILRTTIMVGFPGETEEDFTKLYNFVAETKFDKLGVFKYSKEEGTKAEQYENQVHHRTKESRFNRIMELQNEISKEKLEEKVGKIFEVVIEQRTTSPKIFIGRTYMDTLESDGVVYVKTNSTKNIIGQFVKCKITNADEYDLIGEII